MTLTRMYKALRVASHVDYRLVIKLVIQLSHVTCCFYWVLPLLRDHYAAGQNSITQHCTFATCSLVYCLSSQDVCEVLKNAVRTLLSDCASLMTDISSLVVNMYQSHAHPVILDISKQVCCPDHRNGVLKDCTRC